MFYVVGLHFIGLPDTAFHSVELQSTVNPTPQVVVANGLYAAETLPLPVVFTPLSELPANSTAHVTAAGQQGYAGRAIQRFEPADDGEQLEAIAAGI